MIWHIYGNSEKIVINEQQPHMPKQKYTPSISSSEDTIMQTDEEGDFSGEEETDPSAFNKETIKQESENINKNKSLFLNFTSDLCLQEPYGSRKKKNVPTTNNNVKAQTSFKVNGVNLLNRKNLDSKTVVDRIQKRRENHNHVERRRRDCINNTIFELSRIIPNASLPGQKLNKGNVLKLAVDHILHLQTENSSIKHQLNQVLESRDSVQSSSGLIGNTSSYHAHNNSIRPTGRSTTELSTVTYTGESHYIHQKPSLSNQNPVASTLKPSLPPIKDEKKVTIPQALQQRTFHHYNMDQNLPACTFIENTLYYKGSCRYLQ